MSEDAFYHVIPIDDKIEHVTDGTDCPCDPIRKPNELLVIHNAFDNREFDEIADEVNK